MKNLLLLALFLLSSPVFAEDAAALQKAGKLAFDTKNFPKAALLYRQSFEQEPKGWVAYNSACAYALAGDKESAFILLARAVDNGFIDSENMETDGDLAALRDDVRWGPLLEKVKKAHVTYELLFRAEVLDVPYSETLTPEQRVAGLALVWSELKYNALNQEALMRVNWDKVFLEFLPKVQASASTSAYLLTLREFVHRLDDWNITLFLPANLRDKYEAGAPFTTRLVEGRVLVDDVWDQTLHDRGVKPGVEITSVDGVPTGQHILRNTAWLRAGNDTERRPVLIGNYSFLAGTVDTSAQVEFAAAEGERFSLTVKRIGALNRLKRIEPAEDLIELRPDGIAYIRVAKFTIPLMAEIRKNLAEWKNVRALVIDVRRDNGGRWGAYSLARCLLPKPFDTLPIVSRQNRTSVRMGSGNTENWVTVPEQFQPEPSCQFGRPVYVMTGDETDIAGEVLSRILKRAGRATIIGQQPRAAVYGMPISLPGGGFVLYGAEMLAASNGAPVDSGIAPDVEMYQTINDYRKGIDTVLEGVVARALKETRN